MKFYRCYELATNKPEWSRIKPPGIVQAVFIAPGVRPRLPGVYRLAFGPACQESTAWRSAPNISFYVSTVEKE